MCINLLAWALDDKLWMCWILGARPPETEEGYPDEACLPLQNNPANSLKQMKSSGLNGSTLNLFILMSKVSVSFMVHTHQIQLS